MRRKLIAGNWKLNLGPAAATALAGELRTRLAGAPCDLVVFPTAMSTPATVDALRGSDIAVGAQWAHASASGAFTGCNSATIAAEVGCTWLLAGHSEVRRDLGETDARVHASLVAGRAAGLHVMMALGETLEERSAGRLWQVLERQLDVGLGAISDAQLAATTVAYEPVWAIGTGVVATPDQAQEVHAFIRAWLRGRIGEAADRVRVLYGGSVTAQSARELLALPDVDGCLVGGASLKADAFAGIVAGV